MSVPKISVVTPSYNQGQYLEQTIRSVLDQGYPNLEYVVIDGGSTDNSVEVIKKYADRLKHWESVKDRGQTDAINKGIKHCTGDVFAFINSDDFFYPNSFQRVADTWNSGSRWMAGWTEYLELGGSDWPYMVGPVHRRADWFISNPVPQQSCFFARSLLDEFGPFREDLHYSFDYEYWMRLRFKADLRLTIIRQRMAAFRYHGASKTIALAALFGPEDRQIWEEYSRYLTAKDRVELWRRRREARGIVARDRMWRAMQAKDVPTARREALAATRDQPLSIESWKSLYFAMRGR